MQRILLIGFMLILTMWAHIAVANPSVETFSSSPAERIVLPSAALDKLKIDAGFGWGIFNGSIYNGNDDYAIEQVIIKLIPSQIVGTTSETPLETKEYSIEVTVPPLSKSALSMVLDSDGTQEFEWHLVNVLGRKINANEF